MMERIESEELMAKAAALSKTSLLVESGLDRPFTRVTYPESLDETRLQFPERLISLYHHPVWATLTGEQKWRLSLLETVNFFSVNIHGERRLIQGMEERLYSSARVGSSFITGDYLQHFIHEENAHTHMLAGYCFRYGGGVMRDNFMAIAQPELGLAGEELLFFGRVFVLETFLDFLNTRAMRDTTIGETARQIHEFHHFEEARHIAFDREVIRSMLRQIPAAEVPVLREALRSFGEAALASLYVPKIYKEIGIERPTEVAREVREIPERRALETDWVSATRDFLSPLGLW
ncbi:MAG: diiron oxygenase [Hyphomicrobiaceae bacterium]|nr:diiron oxygenase [Hyphomicrobiaceae bacterium]